MRVAVEVAHHMAVRELMHAHLMEDANESSGVREALDIAQEYRLDQDTLENRAAALRAWADKAPVAMPPRWKDQVTRYIRWESS